MPGQDRVERPFSTVESELYFLIAKFLSSGPCKEASEVLKREIARHELLPKRLDWLGNAHSTNFNDFSRSNFHIPDDFLHRVCSRIGPILDREIKPSISGVQSLLGAGQQNLLRDKSDPVKISDLKKYVNRPKLLPPPAIKSSHKFPLSLALAFQSRQVYGNEGKSQIIPSKFYSNYHLLRRNLGHLSSVYCILFDTAGIYIFTGADDNLVKIWSKIDGRLLSTLRGHSAEITDMDVNKESTLLASGSCDKIIRLWCLQTTAPLAVLTGHTGMITSLKFSPSSKNQARFLTSTGNDGCVLFWQYNSRTNSFNTRPIKYVERAKSGAQMICSSFSPGGTFLATGSADHHIRVYLLDQGSHPEKIFEMEAHLDRVDSLQFAHSSYRFVSGSKDGTAKIWHYDHQRWRSLTLQMNTKLKNCTEPSANKYQVTMVGWSLCDKYVITAVNNNLLKVWNSHDSDLVYVLKGHEDEVFVLECHPTDDRIFLSAGHDGKVIIWDLNTGSSIKTFHNNIDGQGRGAVFDCRFSPDGDLFAATDSHGHVSIFGMGSDEKYKQIPEQIFFHTDYRPLIRDANHHVLDEQTQQAPHLMPPPFLVDIDGNPYPPGFQRLVPGRERCNNDQLTPYVAVSAGGQAEILQAIRPHDDVEHGNQNIGDSNIDDMIEIFENQNRPDEERQLPVERPAELNMNAAPVGMRMDGDVEGVRQSHGNWQSRDRQGEMLAWTKRYVVKKMDAILLKNLLDSINTFGEQELHHYRTHKKKRPAVQIEDDGADEKIYRRVRKQKTRKHGYNVRPRETSDGDIVVRNRVTSSGRVIRQVRYAHDEFENMMDVNQSGNSTSNANSRNRAAGGSNSSSSTSEKNSSESDDSDWEETSSRRKPPPPPPERNSTRRQPKRYENDANDHNYTMVQEPDSDSSLDRYESPRPDFEKSDPAPKPKKRKESYKKANIRSQLPGGVKELPDKFKPSEWLTDVIPKKTPYQPQLGDELMYFPQGHRCYFESVKRVKVYDANIKHQPWTKLKLREQELVRVVGLKYEIKPPRLCCLKLVVINPSIGDTPSDVFTVKYHDMPDVIDFLVLRKIYNLAMERNWCAGNRFRSIIDDAWWIGSIVSQEPFEAEYPDSMFQCFNVKWDNGEKEKMSPWDLEVIDEDRVPEHCGGGVPVFQSEISAILYQPDKDEWPPCGRDVECDRLLRGLEFVMDLAVAEPFNAPVDLNAYPMYAMVVEYPIDLSTIKSRIENRYYRRVKALIFDVKYVETNANLFNMPGTPIVKKAKMVSELLRKFVENPNCEDLMQLYQEISESHHLKDNDASDEDISITGSSDSAQNCGGHYLRERKSPKMRTARQSRVRSVKTFSWKEECEKLVNYLFNCEDSTPFRDPVDQFEYSDYCNIVDHPMDLGTVRDKLQNDRYKDPLSFCKDVRYIFGNSKNFNTNKKSRIYSMTIRLSAIFEERFKVILVKHKESSRLRTYSRLKTSDDIDEASSSRRQLRGRSLMTNGFQNKSGDQSSDESNSSQPEKSTSRALLSDQTSSSFDVINDEDEPISKRPSRQNGHPKNVARSSSNFRSSSKSSSDFDNLSDEDCNKPQTTIVRRKYTRSPKKVNTCRDKSSSENESASNSSNESAEEPANQSESSNAPIRQSKRRLKIIEKSPSNDEESKGESAESDVNGSSDNPDDPKSEAVSARRSVRTRSNNRGKVNGNLDKKRRKRSGSEDSLSQTGVVPKKRMRTRNRGKRTVVYQEDSEYEYYANKSNSDDDEQRPITSVSSRGRVRKLTPLARTTIF